MYKKYTVQIYKKISFSQPGDINTSSKFAFYLFARIFVSENIKDY